MSSINSNGERVEIDPFEPNEPDYDSEPTYEDGLKLGQLLGHLEGYKKGAHDMYVRALKIIAGEQ